MCMNFEVLFQNEKFKIIEFLENPYFQDIHDVVSSYLYTLKEDPESYGYRIGDINRLINEWTYFCNIDELYPKVSTLGYKFD